MIKFYFVRHAQKQKVIGDPSLTEVGIKQAEVTADYFKDKQIQSIFSSPFRRSLETTDIIAKKLNLSVQKDNRLIERMNWGDKKKETIEEFFQEWRKTDRDRNYQPIHGDSSRKAGERIELFLQEISKKYNQGNFLFITHGGVIGDFLRNVFPQKDLPIVKDEKYKVKYLDILECSITTVRKIGEKFILDKVGSVNHLPVILV